MDNEEPGQNASHAFWSMDQYVSLISGAMMRSHTSCANVSRQTGISKAKLSRCLSGKNAIDLPTVRKLFLALDIDLGRALLAISQYGDWKSYYDPDCELISGLLNRLPDTLAQARGCGERIAVAQGGLQQLATHICDMIAENDRTVVQRRDAFLPDRVRQLRVA